MKTAVLIPLYNHARYLAAALESVRAQTRPPDHVLIVDDGSTDNSAAVAERNLAGLPAELWTQENAGAHATLNRLVALAEERGCEIVAILNSDDLFASARLERGLAFLAAHPETALLCTRLRLIDADGHPLPADSERARWLDAAWAAGALDPNPETGGPDLPSWLGRVNFAATTSNFIARTGWLRDHPFLPYRYAHDYAALVRAALGNRLSVLDERLLDYRVHAENTINAAPGLLTTEMLGLALDLAREVAPQLLADPPARAAYTRWRRAGWENISAFRADVFEVASAHAIRCLPPGEAAALLAAPGLSAALSGFPNPTLADARAHPAALAERCAVLEAQLEAARADVRARAELRRLQTLLLHSRWYAFGRLLGRVRPIYRAGGKTAEEKLETLRERLRHSPWLKLGSRSGSHAAKELLQRTAAPMRSPGEPRCSNDQPAISPRRETPRETC